MAVFDQISLLPCPSVTPLGWPHGHAAQLIESGHRVEILGLVVSHTVRRSGIGRALVSEAERWAATLGAETIVVRSNLTREESHAIYPTIGYEPVKTQRVYRKGVARGTRGFSSAHQRS